MPLTDTIILDTELLTSVSIGDSDAILAPCRYLVFYVIGSPGLISGDVIIEESASPDGPWVEVFENSIAVKPDAVVVRSAGPGAYLYIRARITTAVVGGSVTVRVIGTVQHRVPSGTPGYTPFIRLTIAGVPYAMQVGSVNYTDDLNSINTLTFSVYDEDRAYVFETGQEVVLRNQDNIILYAGTIERLRSMLDDDLRTGIFHTIECIDRNALPSRKVIAEAYDNTSFEDIVLSLVLKYLAPDGISIGAIDPGPIYTRKIFDYKKGDQVLNDLSDDTGYAWWIDYEGRFFFRNRLATAAPFVATTSVVRYSEFERSKTNYRNRQYVRAGRDLTDPIPEHFVGDTVRQTFSVGLPIGAQPTITVNAVVQAVGIGGVQDEDLAFNWFWNKDNTEVYQRRELAPLGPTDTIVVTYRGLFPTLVQAQNDTEIIARAAIEGGSGVYEEIEEHTEIESSSLAFDIAVARLQRKGDIGRKLTIAFDNPGLMSGQFLHVILPYIGVDSTFLVQQVTAGDAGETFMRYTAQLLEGEAVGGWLAFYQRLMQQKQVAAPRENELLLLLRNTTEAVLAGESLVITTQAGETRIGHAQIGMSEIA